MPASQEVIPGVKMLVEANSTLIGGQEDCTLNLDIGSEDVNHKTDYGWAAMLQTLVGWNVDVSGFWLEGSTPKPEDGFGASLGLRDVGGSSYSVTPGLDSLTISLSLGTYERSNQDHGGFVIQAPDLRSATVSAEIDYSDPNANATGAIEKILKAALEDRANLEFQASFGQEGSTFSGEAMVVPGSLGATAGDDTTLSVDLNSQGPITNGVASADPGLTALLDAFFADPVEKLAVQMGVQMAQDGTFTPDYTKFYGDAWLASAEITIPASGSISTSFSFAGASELTREVVSAA